MPDAQRKRAAIGVLVFAFLTTALGRGMGESYAVFLLPIGDEMLWERASLSSVYAVYMLCAGLGAPLAGIMMDRWGPRSVYGCGLVAVAVGFSAAGHLTELWQFYLFIGALGGVGGAMLGIVPAQGLISRWFDKKLATAASLAYAGMGFGTLAMAPLADRLIHLFGWREAYQYLGVLFVCLLPLIIFLPWRRMGEGTVTPTSKFGGDGGPTLRQALTTRAFWGLLAAFMITAVSVYGVSLQSVAYLVEQGFTRLQAAGAFGAAGMLSFVGMALTGMAADRCGRGVTATISYTFTLIGLAALFTLQIYPSSIVVVVFVVFFGLSMGARGPIISTLVAQIFAGRGLGAIFGTITLGQGLGAAIGAWCSGWLYDATGSYDTGFVLSSIGVLIGMSLFWIVPEMRPERKGAD
jgi:MFS family permease